MTFPTSGYPSYKNRHTASGDLNPPSLGAGAPTDPALPAASRRRVFLGREVVVGFPLNPANATYLDGTALVGRGEEVTSDVANRGFYEIWRSHDSLAERPRYPVKLLKHAGADSANQLYWELATFDPTGGGAALSNDYLVYIGPSGTTSSDIHEYIAALSSGTPARNSLSPVTAGVVDVLSDLPGSGGVSLLDPTTPTPTGGYFPSGSKGTLLTAVASQITANGGAVPRGPDTVTDDLTGYCIYNYSLSTRTEQSAPEDLWKAFAICLEQAGGAGNPADLNHDVQAAGWVAGDVLYYTTVALAPVLQFNAGVDIVGGETSVLSGGWDRLENGDSGADVAAIIYPAVARDNLPCFEIGLDVVETIFSWDGHNAMFRARMDDIQPDLVGFVAIDRSSNDTNKAFASFVQLQAMSFNNVGVTELDVDATNEFSTVGNEISLAGGKLFHSGAGVTDLILDIDLVELYEDDGGSAGRLMGIWSIGALVGGAGTTVSLVGIDGDIVGTGIPAIGWLRVLRPVFRQGSSDDCSGPEGVGLSLISQKIGGTNYCPFTLFGLQSSSTDFFALGYARQANGTKTLKFAVSTAGDLTALGDAVVNGDVTTSTGDFKYGGGKTPYYQCPLQSGVDDSAAPAQWEYYIAASYPYWKLGNEASTPSIDFPVKIPIGAQITDIAVKYYINARVNITGNEPSIALLTTDVKWGSSTTAPTYVEDGDDLVDTDGWQVFSYSLVAPVTVDDDHAYCIRIKGTFDAGPAATLTDQRIAGVRVYYTMDTVAPA